MKHKAFIIAAFIAYIILITVLMIIKGIGITPDRFIPLFIIPSLFIKRTRAFLLDFLPLLFILLSYEYLRGLADSSSAHYFDQISIDFTLFHSLPTVTLQKLLFNGHSLHWYDYAATIIYFMHFVWPLVFAYILWIINRQFFKEFITGLSLLSYAGWLTFLLYPSAPPWMASNAGFIPHVTKIMTLTMASFPQQINLPTIYTSFDPNPVAAMPSLHAAYPFLIFLFGMRFFGKKFLPFLLYNIALWFSVIYLGEHYFSDCLGGLVYALISYLITIKLLHNDSFTSKIAAFKWVKRVKRRFKKLGNVLKLPSFVYQQDS